MEKDTAVSKGKREVRSFGLFFLSQPTNKRRRNCVEQSINQSINGMEWKIFSVKLPPRLFLLFVVGVYYFGVCDVAVARPLGDVLLAKGFLLACSVIRVLEHNCSCCRVCKDGILVRLQWQCRCEEAVRLF